MNVQSSTLRAAALLLAFGSALACSAILKPKDKVTRCGTADDCDPTGDNRYVPLCKFDDAHSGLDSTKVDKICVADYKSITCAADQLMGAASHPITIAVGKSACSNTSCDMANNGARGCPTNMGNCNDGLSALQFGEVTFCGMEGDVPGFGLPDGFENKHIEDMYCKSFFCDEDFVCGPNGKCQLCEGDDFLDGGCGTVYVNGAEAPVYVLGDALEQGCAGEDADANDALFGDVCLE